MLPTAGLAGPVRRSPLVTALLPLLLKLYNEEQLKEDPAPGEEDVAGEPADDCNAQGVVVLDCPGRATTRCQQSPLAD
eukprot:695833-Amphidinium_carterae.1